VDLNRFSILRRLSPEQVKSLCAEFNLEYGDFVEATTGKFFNEILCDKICKLLGYRKWYPKYWPKGMANNSLVKRTKTGKVKKKS
jgi:hypothetical protein